MTASLDSDLGSAGASPAFDPSTDLPTLANAVWGALLRGAPDSGYTPTVAGLGAGGASLAPAITYGISPPPPGVAASGPQSVTAPPLVDASQLQAFDPTGGVTLDSPSATTPLQLDAQNYLQGYGIGPQYAPATTAPGSGKLESDLDVSPGTASPGSFEVAGNNGPWLNRQGVPNGPNPQGGDKSPAPQPNAPAWANAKTSPVSQIAPKLGGGAAAAAGFGGDSGAPPVVSDAAAFADIVANEASGGVADADRMTAPKTARSGWSIGWEQEDFHGDPKTAQTTLTNALTASGYLDTRNAEKAAAAFSAAKTSPTVDLSGIVDIQGHPVDLGKINGALGTLAAAPSIKNSSVNNYASKSHALMASLNENENVLPSVRTTLSDPVYGPMLTLIMLDYNNQMKIGLNPTDSMMSLITKGSARRINEIETTLDQTNAQSITNSIMKYYLNSQYASGRYGADVTRRLTNDVQAAIIAENNAHMTPPKVPMTIKSKNGTMVISPVSRGGSYRGTWTPSS